MRQAHDFRFHLPRVRLLRLVVRATRGDKSRLVHQAARSRCPRYSALAKIQTRGHPFLTNTLATFQYCDWETILKNGEPVPSTRTPLTRPQPPPGTFMCLPPKQRQPRKYK